MLRAIRSYEQWTSDQPDTEQALTTALTPGMLVIWGKAAFRVVSLEDLNRGNWRDEDEQAWEEAGRPDIPTWTARPMWLSVQYDNKTETGTRGGIVPADAGWVILPEHYSVCRQCGELPPCAEVFADRVMAVEAQRIEFEMRLTHGMCHGCGHIVTPREHSILFSGDNLIRPDLGSNTAVFHTRRHCLPIVLAYQDRWLAVDPSRKPRITSDGSSWRPAGPWEGGHR
ncbi:hypothetical protein [Actinacidiphila acididurans]|uniref:Uncharacterized protein n=1 Tax=Actinacidiphila acididurans TaxID=2784346 RepID=A0ABS2U2W2_9ACTN|nr:hypothetical protein [Actinacidiphila acididurans]MBM9509928.1 hypothetical protein [Actinacidiphila acididurans]